MFMSGSITGDNGVSKLFRGLDVLFFVLFGSIVYEFIGFYIVCLYPPSLPFGVTSRVQLMVRHNTIKFTITQVTEVTSVQNR